MADFMKPEPAPCITERQMKAMYKGRGLAMIAAGAMAWSACGEAVDPAEASADLGTVHQEAVANASTGFLQVYINNIENKSTTSASCPGDWKDLVSYMKQQTYAPDLFLVQQVAGQADADALAQQMSTVLGFTYIAYAAEANPNYYQSGTCPGQKDYQTNAVIFRAGRFNNTPASVVRFQAKQGSGSGTCVDNGLSRTKAIALRLYDSQAQKYVVAASVHWPKNSGGGPGDDPDCLSANVNTVHSVISGMGGAALIWGGDLNESARNPDGSFKPWFQRAQVGFTGNLNYRDPVYTYCASTADLSGCLNNNFTFASTNPSPPTTRIDHLFVRNTSGSLPSATNTVSGAAANTADAQVTASSDSAYYYSNHLAVRSYLYY
jgi:hypothetical protein